MRILLLLLLLSSCVVKENEPKFNIGDELYYTYYGSCHGTVHRVINMHVDDCGSLYCKEKINFYAYIIDNEVCDGKHTSGGIILHEGNVLKADRR